MRPIKTKIIAQIISSALEISNNITDATDDLFSYLTDDCRMCEDLANRHTNSIAAAARQNDAHQSDALAGCKHGFSHELDRRIEEAAEDALAAIRWSASCDAVEDAALEIEGLLADAASKRDWADAIRRISEVLGANLPSNIGQVLTKRLTKILAAHGY
jgi:hypothetical protein